MTILSDLDTVGVIAGWDEGTRGARGRALLHPSRLETNTFWRGLRIAAMEDHDNATITGQRFNETR